jgi:hypothetical protein
MSPHRQIARVSPRRPRGPGGLLLGAVVVLAGCTSYILGPADEASVRASLALDARVYRGLDGGVLRAFARAAACNDEAVLRRSGLDDEAGTPLACELPR